MDFQQLQYVVEVARTRSISAAAKNLYMSQPNLSKSVKELEMETGIEIFHRTAKGVELTPRGADFVEYAKPILKQMEILEGRYSDSKNTRFFGVSAPRATYIASIFSRYIGEMDNRPVVVNYHETNPLSVIHQVSSGESQLGIVRFAENRADYFIHLIEEHNIKWELIREFQMVAMMSKHHFLADHKEVTPDELNQCTQITQGDLAAMLPIEDVTRVTDRKRPRQIKVYDRGSQFHFLRQIEDSYMWVSPVPQAELERHELIELSCTGAKTYRDIAIYRDHIEFGDMIDEIIRQLQQCSPFKAEDERAYSG